MSVLILLAGDFIRPQRHLSNGCICWFRFSVVFFSDCKCQALVGDRKSGLEKLLSGLEDGIFKVDPCECVDPVGRGFGPPPEPLDEHMYLLVQVQCGSP